MGLTAATYLGDNTVPVLADLVATLRGGGLDIAIDEGAGRDSRDARAHAADVDLVWMCGCLTMVLADEGVLDHEVVAAPVFPGETEAVYRSVYIARGDGPGSIDEALAGTIGLNEPESWSGHHGLRADLGDRWFASEVSTGSHRGSIDAVAGGTCDVAGIDHSIWDHVAATEPDAVVGLRVIGTTGDWPAPPFLLRPGTEGRDTVLSALLAEPPAGLSDVRPASAADYAAVRP